MTDGMLTPQASFLRERLGEMEEANHQVRCLAQALSDPELTRRPAQGGWSVAEVLEHLVISGGDYLRLMRPAITAAREAGAHDQGRAWQPTLTGRVLVHSLRTGRSGMLKSPRAWQPRSPRERVREAFFASQQELASAAREAEGLDLARIRTHSPLSKLIRLNLGDCFLILNVHCQRHLSQIRRIRDQLEVPLPTV